MQLTYWRCWACNKEYKDRKELTGDLLLNNGEDGICFGWMCRACVKKAATLLRENFVGAREKMNEIKA